MCKYWVLFTHIYTVISKVCYNGKLIKLFMTTFDSKLIIQPFIRQSVVKSADLIIINACILNLIEFDVPK